MGDDTGTLVFWFVRDNESVGWSLTMQDVSDMTVTDENLKI